MSTNTSNSQQEANFLEDDNAGSNEEVNNPIIPESHEQDTGVITTAQAELDTIPEEEE